MSYSLNSSRGVVLYAGLYRGVLLGFIKGDTRSLDHSSCAAAEDTEFVGCILETVSG